MIGETLIQNILPPNSLFEDPEALMRKDTSKHMKEIRKLLQNGRSDPYVEPYLKQGDWIAIAKFIGAIIVGSLIWILIILSINAFAFDKCQDPGLKPELQKACYQMEKICQEVGCSVGVR